MAFIVEDGTVVADANSLTAVAFADAFFSDRREARWIGDGGPKEAALIRATDWFEQSHGTNIKGDRTVSTQVLSFPRKNLFLHGFLLASTVVPDLVQQAVCLYALRALARADIAPDPDLPGGKGAVIGDEVTIGPIKVVSRFASPSDTPGDETIPQMPEVQLLLAPILSSISDASGVSFGSTARG